MVKKLCIVSNMITVVAYHLRSVLIQLTGCQGLHMLCMRFCYNNTRSFLLELALKIEIADKNGPAEQKICASVCVLQYMSTYFTG